MVGIAGFARGGDFNRRNANRLMRWRIAAQAVAVVLIVAFAWFGSRG
jgi:anti-sigma-K factor RskA